MDLEYLAKIKEIMDKEKIVSFSSFGDKFNIDDAFYVFQYPDHFADYFDAKTWKAFEIAFLKPIVDHPMTIPERWKHCIPEHIKDKKVAELSCNIGAETYHIRKDLEPRELIAFDVSPISIELTNLMAKMFDFKNVKAVQADFVKKLDEFPDEYTDFDVTIMSGHFYSFNYHKPKKNREFVENSLKNLMPFLDERTTEYLYFLAVDDIHLDAIQTYFSDKVTILDTTRFRPSRNYTRKTARFFVEELMVDRKQDIFSGYVKL